MFKLIRIVALVAASSLLALSPANALTFKRGQVLGSDGEVYDGASPTQREKLISRAADGDETAGVAGSNLFVVMDGEVVFIPLSDLRGKTQETRMDIVKAHVIANIADLEVEDLLEEAGNLEEALASRLAGIEAGVEAGLSVADSTALDNALATASTAAEQAAAQTALESALAAAEGIDEEVEALFNDEDSVFDSEGNYLGSFSEMCSSGEISGC